MERTEVPLVILAVVALALLACIVTLAGTGEAARYGVDLGFTGPGNLKTHVPPDPVTFNLTVYHPGTEATEDVIVELLNEPAGWSHNLLADTQQGISSGTDDLEFQLARGEVATLAVTLVPRAGMDNGTYWLTLRARVRQDAGATDSVNLGVTITRRVDFSVVLWKGPPDDVFEAVPPATVTVQFAVYNKGNAEDRFLVKVGSSLCELGWVPVIVTGVDGLGWTPALPPDPGMDSPHVVTVEVTMPADSIAGAQCSLMAEATSEADQSLVRAPAGAVLRALQHYGFRVRVDGPSQRVGRVGETVEFHLVVENQANGPDTFRVFAAWNEEYAPGWFARPDPSELDIGPFANDTVDYLVKLPMNATLGKQVFHAEIWSSSTELASVSRTLYVEVAPHYDLVAWADEAEATTDPGGSVRFDVHVTNTGNALDSYNLSWVAWDEAWIFYFIPDSVSAKAGESTLVNASMRVPGDLGSSPQPSYTFEMRFESVLGDAEATVPLTVHIRPFGRVEWLWDGEPVTSPAAPVAAEGTLRPKPVIDVYNGTTSAFSLFVRNSGNIEDNITFWARSWDDRVAVTVLPEWRVVPAGRTVEVFVQISVPDSMFPGEHRVWVNTTSSDRRQDMRAVPVEFDVIPYYDTLDFAGLRWEDPLEDDFEYSYTMEGNDVVSSRGRRARHADLDILSLTGVLDVDTATVTFTLELKGSPSQDPGIFYGLYLVTPDHAVEGNLLDPASHERGDFVWESHDEGNTVAFMYLSDQQKGSSVPMPSLTVTFHNDRVVFTVHARDLRTAGLDPGSDFHLYAYCHRLGSSDGGQDLTTLVYDTGGQGATDAPWEFTDEPGEAPSFLWIGVAVAVVAALAFLFVVLLPRLMPKGQEEEVDDADEWVEYH